MEDPSMLLKLLAMSLAIAAASHLSGERDDECGDGRDDGAHGGDGVHGASQ